VSSKEAKPWSKWESGAKDQENYGLFSEWLHSADYSTSIRADVMDWARECGKDMSQVVRLSVTWLWDERAKAYDAWRALQPICKVAPLFSHHAEMMNRIVKEELRRMELQQTQMGDVGTMKHRDIIRMVEQLRKAEQFCVEALERQRAAMAAGTLSYDYGKLTVAELRTLEDLNEKAKVQ
jgi:hypothetical protein